MQGGRLGDLVPFGLALCLPKTGAGGAGGGKQSPTRRRRRRATAERRRRQQLGGGARAVAARIVRHRAFPHRRGAGQEARDQQGRGQWRSVPHPEGCTVCKPAAGPNVQTTLQAKQLLRSSSSSRSQASRSLLCALRGRGATFLLRSPQPQILHGFQTNQVLPEVPEGAWCGACPTRAARADGGGNRRQGRPVCACGRSINSGSRCAAPLRCSPALQCWQSAQSPALPPAAATPCRRLTGRGWGHSSLDWAEAVQ